jgi:magnesium transporter
MQRLYHRPDGAGRALVPHPVEDLDGLVTGDGWVWLDVEAPTRDELVALDARFGFGKLVMEDLLEPTLYPRVVDFEDGLFVVMHALAPDTTRLRTIEIDAYLRSGLLVTVHAEPVPAIDWVRSEGCDVPELADGGPDRMIARIADGGARRYLPLIDALDDRIAELEDLAVTGERHLPGEIQGLRRDAVWLRRVIAPQRDVFRELSREGHRLVSTRARQRFEDVYVHHDRIVDGLDSARLVLAATLETYRSTVAETMNEVMKLLTVFSAILLPLSVLAGIYGMNFEYMPELAWRWGYFALLGVMAVTAGGLWIWFARRGFVGGPRWRRVPAVVGRGLADLVHLTVLPIRAIGGIAGQVIRGSEDRDEPPS